MNVDEKGAAADRRVASKLTNEPQSVEPGVECCIVLCGRMPVCAATGPVLKIETEKQPTKTIVHCTGRINLESWALFSTTVRGLFAENKTIRVDLTNVLQVDSTGIGAFVSVWASAKGSGCDLKFVNPNKQVQDVVEITKLHDMFERVESGSGS